MHPIELHLFIYAFLRFKAGTDEVHFRYQAKSVTPTREYENFKPNAYMGII